jgi:hypothetical protein
MKIGQRVWYVFKDGMWHNVYGGRYFEEVNWWTSSARVISFDDDTVVIWIEQDETDGPSFVLITDIFENEDDAWKAVEIRNLQEFGHKSGKWAAETAKRKATKVP